MSKILVVIDMQNDFVTGSLGTNEAKAIVLNVVEKIKLYQAKHIPIIYTRDTHDSNYLNTLEGKFLPVEHCLKDTHGWEIISELTSLMTSNDKVIDKPIFGSVELVSLIQSMKDVTEVELVGLCTDICVVSNAIMLKNQLLDVNVVVDASCCAGVTHESHEAALLTMKMCQIIVTS